MPVETALTIAAVALVVTACAAIAAALFALGALRSTQRQTRWLRDGQFSNVVPFPRHPARQEAR